MRMQTATKRHLIPILIAILIVSFLPFSGCGEKEPTLSENQVKGATLSEQQVIEMTQEYWIRQPGELIPGVPASYFMCARFAAAVIDAQGDFLKENEGGKLGEFVSIQLCDSSSMGIYVAALKKLAKYDGDGLWSVYICGQWQVNEITGEVTPQDEEAIKELEDLNLKTYSNKIYGYYIKYPASWSVYESGDTVNIYLTLRDAISISVLPRGTLQTADLQLVVNGMTANLQNEVQDFQLISKGQLYGIGDVAWEVIYTGKIEDSLAFKVVKWRIIAYKNNVYMISGGAPGLEFPTELESAINSFTLFK